jgi:hypothetical protein
MWKKEKCYEIVAINFYYLISGIFCLQIWEILVQVISQLNDIVLFFLSYSGILKLFNFRNSSLKLNILVILYYKILK